MISALLGRDQLKEKGASPEELGRHVINLLEIAAENAALAQHRAEYQREFENSTKIADG
jgi:hypothetical protein